MGYELATLRRLVVALRLCLLSALSALILMAAPARAFDGGSYAEVILPSTGDIFPCVLRVRTTPFDTFSVSGESAVTVTVGLDRVGGFGYFEGQSGSGKFSAGLTPQNGGTLSRCNMHSLIFPVIQIPETDVRREADFLRLTIRYQGINGRFYEATGTLSGLTNTVATASVTEIPAVPEFVFGLNLDERGRYRDRPSGTTIDVGTLEVGERLVLDFKIGNQGVVDQTVSNVRFENVVNSSLGSEIPAGYTETRNNLIDLPPITVAPRQPGPFSFTLAMTTNDPAANPALIHVTGVAPDRIAPVLSTVTPVPTPAASNGAFTFSSTEAGTLTSNCLLPPGTPDTVAAGETTVTFLIAVGPGASLTVSDCRLYVTDAAGNQSNTLTVPPFTIDKQGPAVTLSALPPLILAPTPVRVTLSEPVEGFTLGDIAVTGAVARDLTGSGRSYQFVLVPSGTGDITAQIPANGLTDALGNQNTASNLLTTRFDSISPGVTLAGAPDFASGPFEVALYFTEPVDGLAASYFSVTGGTAEIVFTSISIPFGINGARARITPDLTGLVTVSMPAGAVQDQSDNDSLASNEVTVQLDLTPPTVTIADFTENGDGTLSTTITTSEVPNFFFARDLTVVNGTAYMTGSGTSYDVTIIPAVNGPVRLSVAAGEFRDPGGNLNLASNEVTADVIVARPEVTIGALTGPLNGAQTATITLSLPSTDFTVEDLDLTNATAVLTGSGTGYSVTLTPVTDGAVGVSVPENVFSDAFGAANLPSNFVSRDVDLTPPTVTISPLATPLSGPQTVTVTMSEPVTGFGWASLTRTNVNAVVTGSGSSYTVALTPIADGPVALSIAAGEFRDAAGNDNLASNIVTGDFNTGFPSVNIGALTGPATGPFTAAITLGEPSTDFTDAALALVNATAVLSGSGTDYVVTLTPLADGLVSLSVPAGAFTSAGLGNTASNLVTATADITGPAVVITPFTGPGNGAQSATIILSEPVTGLTEADLDLLNATATLTGSGTTYEAILTPLADGFVSVSIPAGAFTDAAGNLNTLSNTVTGTVDLTPPSITIGALSGPADGDQTALITLSEPSTDFTVGDLSVTNATATLTGSGSAYTAVLTPLADGAVTLSVAAGAFSDAAGNLNTASNEVTRVAEVSTLEVDFFVTEPLGTTPVTEVFGAPALAQFVPQVTSSLPIVSYDWQFGDTNTSINLSPIHSYTTAGNFNVRLTVCTATQCRTAIRPLTVRFGTPGDVVLSGLDGGLIAGPVTITAVFETGVSDRFGPPLSLDLFSVAGAELSALSGPPPATTPVAQTFTFLLTPTGGDISLSLPAGVVYNIGFDPNRASNVLTASIDIAAPSVALASPVPLPNGDFTVAITLSEASIDFTVDDLTVVNASAVLSGSGADYVATLTPLADGAVSLSVAADVFTDAAGNLNTASNVVSANVDRAGPGVTLSASVASVLPGGAFDVTVTFSEPVKGFEAGDLSVMNGSVSDVAGAGADYTARIIATGGGDVSVSVPAGVAQDSAGNLNLAAEPLVVTVAGPEESQRLIAQFMQSRANQLLASQPKLTGFLGGQTGNGSFDANVTRGQGTLSFSTAQTARMPIWSQLTASWSEEAGRQNSYVFGVVGSHRSLSDTLLVGAMVQVDHLRMETGDGRVSGTGWLIGPYFAGRLADQPLFFEGRLLWGQSENEVRRGAAADRFRTDRMLAQFGLEGRIARGATTFTPGLGLSYTTDRQRAYTDSFGNPVPAQSVTLGQLEAGLGFQTLLNLEDLPGTVTLTGSGSYIYSLSEGTGFARSVVPEYEGGRGRIELGLRHDTGEGVEWRLDSYYDGLGARDFESYGLGVEVTLRF